MVRAEVMVAALMVVVGREAGAMEAAAREMALQVEAAREVA